MGQVDNLQPIGNRPVARVCDVFHPKVFAFSPNVQGVNCVLRDGDSVRMGDQDFEVIHMPGHSSDSICFYNQEEGVLFVGDSPVLSASAAGTYEPAFLAALERCAPAMSGGSISGTGPR